MNAAVIVFPSQGKACLESFEIPCLAADEVLVESSYSVISAGTEVANLQQLPNTVSAKNDFPHYPGYSGTGIVVDVGTGVEKLCPGDRVVVPWGGHRSHVVKKAEDVLRIDDNAINLMDASFAHIASFSFLGVRKLRLELGESAVVAGMGILGVFALQIAALSGAVPVLALDFDETRRALARDLGAAAAFSPDEEELAEKIRDATGGTGPNAVVEVTGSAAALQQALEYIAWEGRISLLGCTRISDVPIDFYKYVHRRGVALLGAHTYARPKLDSAPGRWTERDDYRTFVKLLAAERMQVRSLISEVVSPAAADSVYARLAQESNPPLGVVFDWSRIR